MRAATVRAPCLRGRRNGSSHSACPTSLAGPTRSHSRRAPCPSGHSARPTSLAGPIRTPSGCAPSSSDLLVCRAGPCPAHNRWMDGESVFLIDTYARSTMYIRIQPLVGLPSWEPLHRDIHGRTPIGLQLICQDSSICERYGSAFSRWQQCSVVLVACFAASGTPGRYPQPVFSAGHMQLMEATENAHTLALYTFPAYHAEFLSFIHGLWTIGRRWFGTSCGGRTKCR